MVGDRVRSAHVYMLVILLMMVQQTRPGEDLRVINASPKGIVKFIVIYKQNFLPRK